MFDEGDEKVVDFVKPLMKHCLAACQKASNLKDSLAAVEITPVMSMTKSFKRFWNNGVTLPSQRRQKKKRNAGSKNFDHVDYYKQGWEDGERHQSQGSKQQSKAESERIRHTKIQLCAFAGLDSIDDLPEIWDKLLVLKAEDYIYARALITKAIIETANVSGIEINKFFLTEQVVKDLLKGLLAPGEVADFNTLERGLSIVAFLKRSQPEISNLKREEEAREESVHTRTYNQAWQGKKKAPRVPPDTFHHTVSLLGTYAMAIKALLTGGCDYFEQVMNLRRTLKGMENKEAVLSAETYRVLVWNVAEDGCQFFSTIVTEDDYTSKGLPDDIAPFSDLRPTITNLRRTLPIKPATFPREWEESGDSSRQRQGVNYGRDGAGGQGGGANRLGRGRG